MEQKKLNLNAPLLSVRRFTSPLKDRFTSPLKDRFISPLKDRITRKSPSPKRPQPLPSPSSELKPAEAAEPVAVPFQWEHIPGRAKGRGGILCLRPQVQAPASPNLPPGWSSPDIVEQPLRKESEDQRAFTPQRKAFSEDDSFAKSNGSKGRVKVECDSDFGGAGEDSYSDERDTLSPASCALSFRVSGLSGSDGPDMKPSGTSSMDLQTRDLMMERFLPAAKAMCLEVPHYASRKQSVASEPPGKVEKEIHGERTPQLDRYGSPYRVDVRKGLHEFEEEDCDKNGDRIVRNGELMHEFSSKGSLCLSHSVQEMETSKHFPKPADIINEDIDKHAWNMDYKHKLDREMKLVEPQGFELKQIGTRSGQLNHGRAKLLEQGELELKQTGVRSGQLNFCRASRETDGPSFNRRSRDGGISPYRNLAPRSSFHGGGFLGVPKMVKNFKVDRPNNEGPNHFEEAPYYQRNGSSSRSGSPAVEKTVYIDSVNIANALHSLSSSDTNAQIFPSDEDNFKALEESEAKKATTTAETYIQDIKCVSPTGRAILKHKGTGHIDATHLRGQLGTMEGKQHSGLQQKHESFKSLKAPADGTPCISNEVGTEDQKKTAVSSIHSTLPPPLPQSPSESWLGRTLPSIISKNSHSYIRGQSPLRKERGQSPLRKEAPVAPPTTAPKWETIVKTSKSRHDHVRYSQELINHVSQQSRT